MEKVTLKIDNMHFFSQLQAWDCRNIKKEQKRSKQNNGKLSKRTHINWQSEEKKNYGLTSNIFV